MPKVGATQYTTLESVFSAILIAIYGFNIYSHGKTMYYYGATGVAMGQFVSEIFVSADAWAGSGIITPTDPWILYDAQLP